jgi:non-ribosomal peptide synthetase component F
MSAFENGDYQFGDIVNKLNIVRDPSRNPIFDTLFSWHNMFIPEMEMEGLEFENYEFEHKVSRFDLSMDAWNKEGQIMLKLEYSTQLFKEETANNIIKDFIKILEAAVQNVKVKINEIELLSSCQIVDELFDEIVEFNFNLIF